MNAAHDCPQRAVSCGDLRREPDGRWFLGDVLLGRDGEPLAVSALDDRLE